MRSPLIARRNLLSLPVAAGVTAPRRAMAISPVLPYERRVGLGYTLWHTDQDWMTHPARQKPWGHPKLGYYVSTNQAVMREHAAWLTGANVDYVLLDWSNEIDTDGRVHRGRWDKLFIEDTTLLLFDTWSKLKAAPKIMFLIGVPQPMIEAGVRQHGLAYAHDLHALTDGGLKRKADQIYEQYVRHPTFGPMVERYLGKPLLVTMIGVPTPYRHVPPSWSDPRFTVRFLSAYMAQQNLATPQSVSKLGYWSWEERRRPTYAVYQGQPEEMTVVAAWRGSPETARGRQEGNTYRKNWAYARQIGPRYVLAGTFNEWWVAEQIDPEHSKDIEPSEEWGTLYLNILREQATKFKAGR